MIMNCTNIKEHLIAYAAGDELDGESAAAVEAHLQHCTDCQRRLDWERRVQGALEAQAVPSPSADFESRVLAAATAADPASAGSGHWKRHSFIGGAVAAALVAGVFLGNGMQSPQAPSEEPTLAETVEPVPAWEREETVKLAFNARSELDDVTLTIELPPHVEVARFPGRQQLSWKVDLQPGDNVIALPLRIAYPEAGELTAHLGEGPNRRTFVAPIPGLSDKDREPAL